MGRQINHLLRDLSVWAIGLIVIIACVLSTGNTRLGCATDPKSANHPVLAPAQPRQITGTPMPFEIDETFRDVTKKTADKGD